jgi:hypothetical protein
MIETPQSMRAEGEWDVNVFECSVCGLDYFTEDHVPVTGLPDRPGVGAQFIAAKRMVLHHRIPSIQAGALQRLSVNRRLAKSRCR